MQRIIVLGKSEKYVNIASALLMLAAASLIWREGNIFFIPIYWISKGAVLGIGCALGIGAFSSSLPRVREFAEAIKQYRFLLILLVTPFLGLMGSSLAGFAWENYFPVVRNEYIRILFGLVLFFCTTYIIWIRPRMMKVILALITATSIPLWLALIPSWKIFALDVGRLRGTGNDANYLAAWIAVALIASIIFFLGERGKIRLVWLTAIFATAPLLLWTVSRAVWFSAAVTVLIICVYFLKERFSSKRVILVGIMLVSMMTSLIIGFLLFPSLSRALIVTRMAGSFISHEKLYRIVQFVSPGENVADSEFFITNNRLGFARKTLLMIKNNRGWLWKEGGKQFLAAPLGFGPGYYFWNPIGIEKVDLDGYGHKLDAHNLWIGVGLAMGWLGFALWVFFMIMVARNVVRLSYSKKPQCLALASSFFMLLLIGLFMDIFTQPILWLIIGLITAFSLSSVTTTPSLPSPSRP